MPAKVNRWAKAKASRWAGSTDGPRPTNGPRSRPAHGTRPRSADGQQGQGQPMGEGCRVNWARASSRLRPKRPLSKSPERRPMPQLRRPLAASGKASQPGQGQGQPGKAGADAQARRSLATASKGGAADRAATRPTTRSRRPASLQTRRRPPKPTAAGETANQDADAAAPEVRGRTLVRQAAAEPAKRRSSPRPAAKRRAVTKNACGGISRAWIKTWGRRLACP